MLLTNLKLDKQTETPLYTQIIDSIKNQLYNDQIAAGDRLPSVICKTNLNAVILQQHCQA